ncbi:MAG: FadR/GntR family transcriptional regulator [Casimicrobiaceae bacterium]
MSKILPVRRKRAARAADPNSLIDTGVNRRLHGSLAQDFGVRILKGDLPEGHVFPGEVELAADLGISRSALREAFRILGAKGLVEGRPKAGTRVCPRRHWSLLDPDLLAWRFESRPSRKFLRDLFELRLMVEPGAAALAASRRTTAQVRTMATALERMARHGLATEEGRLADQRFHLTMLEATRNEAILALASTILSAIAWTTLFKQRKRKLPRDPVPEHLALFNAIKAADPGGSQEAMADLVRLALADTEFSLRKD